MLAGWLAIVDDKRRWIVAAAVGAFIAAQSANANCWQRYHELFLLMLSPCWRRRWRAGAIEGYNPTRDQRFRSLASVAGPLILAAPLAVVTAGGACCMDAIRSTQTPNNRRFLEPRDPAR